MIQTISPVNGRIVVERKCDTDADITAKLQTATKAFRMHRRMTLSERIEIAHRFLDTLAENKDALVRVTVGRCSNR